MVGKLTRFDRVPALIGSVPEAFVRLGDMAWRPIQHRVTWRGMFSPERFVLIAGASRTMATP